LVKLYWFR